MRIERGLAVPRRFRCVSSLDSRGPLKFGRTGCVDVQRLPADGPKEGPAQGRGPAHGRQVPRRLGEALLKTERHHDGLNVC